MVGVSPVPKIDVNVQGDFSNASLHDARLPMIKDLDLNDDLATGGIWAVNDGLPRDMIEYTLDKQVELGMINASQRPTYEQLVDRSIVDDALQRIGGPWTGDPRWY